MVTTQELCSAIQKKQIIQFNYHGHKRIAEPHLVGTKTTGTINLSAYQIDGTSESGTPPMWRNFILADIEDFEITEQTFTSTRPGYNPNDSTMSRIICRI